MEISRFETVTVVCWQVAYLITLKTFRPLFLIFVQLENEPDYRLSIHIFPKNMIFVLRWILCTGAKVLKTLCKERTNLFELSILALNDICSTTGDMNSDFLQ